MTEPSRCPKGFSALTTLLNSRDWLGSGRSVKKLRTTEAYNIGEVEPSLGSTLGPGHRFMLPP